MCVAALLGGTGCTSEASAPSTQLPSSSDGEEYAVTTAPESTHALGGYAGEFDSVTQGFRARSEDLQARVDTSTTDVQEILAFYRELRDIAADARQQYGAISAPSQIQPVHQNILQLFDRQVSLLDDVVEAAQEEDQPALAEAVQGLVELTDEFDQARRSVQQAIAECGQPCMT